MHKAPIASTIIAVSLLPIAALYIHSFISGLKNKESHYISCLLAIIGDLTISIGYMIYRSLGGEAGGSSINLTGNILIYFIVHGIVSLVVIIFELLVLISCINYIKTKSALRYHKPLVKILFSFWWFAFLSGELFYFVYYIF